MRIIMTLPLLALFLLGSPIYGQLENFNKKRHQIDQRLMAGLGSWAGVNLIGSGIAWATTPKGEAHYFHQMNVMWNTVNLGLAIPGYLKARKAKNTSSLSETLDEQYKTEKIFLINSGLDIGYMAGGLLLRATAQNFPEQQEMRNGYGTSLLIQGGFLFLFDIIAYATHSSHRHTKLSPLLKNIELSATGIRLRLSMQ